MYATKVVKMKSLTRRRTEEKDVTKVKRIIKIIFWGLGTEIQMY